MSDIIENAKNITIIPHAIHFPKLHGHMKLELTGCREKQVIEHDNMMTDIFDKMFSFLSGVWYTNTDILQYLSPSIQVALGGILLTDKTLEETALTVPGGTEVTACAAYGVSNGDEALTQGSYNTTESDWDSTSKKMSYVYDWTTNQGNGTIAAAALTHVYTGQCGFGDSGLTYQSNRSNPTGQYCGYLSISSEYGIYADDIYIVSATVANKQLTLLRRYANISKMSPIFTYTLDSEYAVIKKTTIQTDDLGSASISCVSNGVVYLTNSTQISNGSTFKLYALSNVTEEPQIQTTTITNNTGCYLEIRYGIRAYNGKLYAYGFKSGEKSVLCEFDISNPSDQNIYTIVDGNTTTCYTTGENPQSGKIYLSCNENSVVFDTVTKSMKFTKMIEGGYSTHSVISEGMNEISRSNNSRIYKKMNFRYLATINNLESSVVKTADKTMKVTYTIQE